jgi:hypothetical protein
VRRVMAALGRTQVELAAAGLAAAAHLPPGAVLAVLRDADRALRGAARGLADAAEELRAGDPEDAFLPLLAASTVREGAETGRAARAAGFRALAEALAASVALSPGSSAPGAAPPASSPAARWSVDALQQLRAGAGRGDQRVARVVLGGLRIGSAASGPDVDLAATEAGDDLACAIDDAAPFLAVDAVARLLHGRLAEDGEEAFVAVGAWLTATGEPAALQLLKAVWVEEALRGG